MFNKQIPNNFRTEPVVTALAKAEVAASFQRRGTPLAPRAAR